MANGGLFTKLGIGLALATLFITFGLTMLVSIGNEYGLDVNDKYTDSLASFESDSVDINDIALDSLELQEEADIEPDSFGTAQLRGAIGAEQKNIEYSSVIESALQSIQNIIPFPSEILFTILTMTSIVIAGGMYYMLRGVNA